MNKSVNQSKWNFTTKWTS